MISHSIMVLTCVRVEDKHQQWIYSGNSSKTKLSGYRNSLIHIPGSSNGKLSSQAMEM